MPTSELQSALALARRVLDRPSADPDDDLAVLARQLIRQHEANADWADWKTAARIESHGDYPVGVRIAVKLPRDLTDAEKSALSRMADEAYGALGACSRSLDPERQKWIAEEKTELLALFPGAIHAKAIPNGYCSLSYCQDRPSTHPMPKGKGLLLYSALGASLAAAFPEP
jgi:hypothetical protein